MISVQWGGYCPIQTTKRMSLSFNQVAGFAVQNDILHYYLLFEKTVSHLFFVALHSLN